MRTSFFAGLLLLVASFTSPKLHAQGAVPPLPSGVNLQGDTSHPPSADVIKMITAMRGWDSAKATPINPSGLKLRFVEFDKRKINGGNFIAYRAYADGAPTSIHYSLILWPLDGQMQVVMQDLYVNKKGLLMCNKPTPAQENSDSVAEQDEVDLLMQSAKGEPKRYALVSEEPKLFIPGTVVSYPLESKDKACEAQALIGTSEAALLFLKGKGFAPKIQIALESTSAGEHQSATFTSDDNGELFTALFPFVEGKDHGIVDIHLSTPDCTLKLSVPWGKDSYQVE